MAPGSRLLGFASQWFDERTVARVFEPLLADYQREWAEASPARRRLATIRTVAAFIVSAIALSPRAILFTPTPASITRRIIARMILFVSITSGLLMVPFLSQLREIPPGRLAWLLMWLAPSTLLFVFPFAMGFVVDGVRRHRQPTPIERVAILRVGIVAVVLMIIIGGWIVPASNQQFRVEVRPDPPPARGAKELTTPQLFQTPWLARAERMRTEAVQRELHSRASFALLPVVLIWMRWRALRFPSPQWLLPAWLASITTFASFVVLRSNERAIEAAYGLPVGAGVWVPLVMFVLVGFTRDYFARRVPA